MRSDPQEIRFFRNSNGKNNFAISTAMYEHSNSCKKREPKEADQTAEGSSSEEEHMENALALGAEEGRDKLR